MWAAMPRSFAARESAAAWFPEECVATPRARLPAYSAKTPLARTRRVNATARAGDVMMQEFAPPCPKLRIEKTVNVMVMNRFERFQKLMGHVEKARLILRR